MTARYIVGDSLTVLRSLPDASVDLVLTSPPFLALRSYLPADHPDKALEMGSEPTPAAFIDALLTLTEECRRVLTPHGSLCVELGDTYSGSGGAGGDYNVGGLREGQGAFDGSSKRRRKANGHAVRDDAPRPPRDGRRHRADDEEAGILTPRRRPGPEGRDSNPGWPLDKSLCLIPELYRIALVYGFNPLTGRTTPRWRARNVVRWVRPNPPVGALGDKFRPATSEMVVACIGRKRYFDLGCLDTTNPAGAPPLDWWAIPTEPYPGSHYATWPSDLLVRPIRAMCPERVCQECGAPSERITEPLTPPLGTGFTRTRSQPRRRPSTATAEQKAGGNVTLGWTDCGHEAYRPGVVLDPFAGSGTTIAVATGHGRDAIGVDLDERNADLARQRVGMFLTVEHFATEVPA